MIQLIQPLFLKTLTAIQIAASECVYICSSDSRRRKSMKRAPEIELLDSPSEMQGLPFDAKKRLSLAQIRQAYLNRKL
jgi:hypothetical protein